MGGYALEIMKLNTEIKITVKWNEEEKVNKQSFEFDINQTPSTILTALEMTKNSVTEILENYIKTNFDGGKCTEKELKKIMNSKFKTLTTI